MGKRHRCDCLFTISYRHKVKPISFSSVLLPFLHSQSGVFNFHSLLSLFSSPHSTHLANQSVFQDVSAACPISPIALTSLTISFLLPFKTLESLPCASILRAVSSFRASMTSMASCRFGGVSFSLLEKGLVTAPLIFSVADL